MLDRSMRNIIQDYPLGLVASVTPQGRPAVSPKGTFFILNPQQIACAHIRSPKTVRNIQLNPHVQINFIDILARRAVRIEATAHYTKLEDADSDLIAAFRMLWADYEAVTKGMILFDIEQTELIKTPSYDLGAHRDELVASYLAKLTAYANKR